MDKLIPIKKNINEIIDVCNTSFKDMTKKQIFKKFAPIFLLNSINYKFSILRNNYEYLQYLKKFEEKINGLDYEDFVKIYEQRFVPEKREGRPFYNQIMQIAKYNRCPYCGVTHVSTLDHIFPKKEYSVLSVDPLNLVPSCKDCNTTKKTSYNLYDPTIHPYFDDTNTDIWLFCTISNNQFEFSVKKPDNFDEKLFKRIERTFVDLNLAFLYEFQANSEFMNIKDYLGDLLFQEREPYLKARVKSLKKNKLNSWQVAMYSEMSTNITFLNSL